MTNDQFEQLLDRLEITFYWYEHNKFWWVRKTHPDGKIVRSNPVGAESLAAAQTAAAKFIRRQFR